MREVLVFDFDRTLANPLEGERLIFNQLAPDYGYNTLNFEKALELRHLNLGGVLKIRRFLRWFRKGAER